MTGKRATTGRGRAPAAGRQTGERKSGGVVPTGLGQRLRESREKLSFLRKTVADTLNWSESRLISYETGVTEPNASEIEKLARMYGRDRAWLAFGDDYERMSGGRAASTLWLACIDGGELAVPVSLVTGMAGPLQCAVIGEDTGLGLSRGDVLVVQPSAAPAIGALWALRGASGGILSGWIVATSRSSVNVKLDLAGGAVAVSAAQLLGRVAATMQRAVQSDQVPTRRPAGRRR